MVGTPYIGSDYAAALVPLAMLSAGVAGAAGAVAGVVLVPPLASSPVGLGVTAVFTTFFADAHCACNDGSALSAERRTASMSSITNFTALAFAANPAVEATRRPKLSWR